MNILWDSNWCNSSLMCSIRTIELHTPTPRFNLILFTYNYKALLFKKQNFQSPNCMQKLVKSSSYQFSSVINSEPYLCNGGQLRSRISCVLGIQLYLHNIVSTDHIVEGKTNQQLISAEWGRYILHWYLIDWYLIHWYPPPYTSTTRMKTLCPIYHALR